MKAAARPPFYIQKFGGIPWKSIASCLSNTVYASRRLKFGGRYLRARIDND